MKTFQLFLLGLLLSNNIIGQNLGINNFDPQAALDLKGDLRLRTATLNLPQGISHNVDLITNKAVNYNFDGGSLNGAIISGFTGGVDGRLVTIFNNGASAIQLYDEAAGSFAQNRILTGNGNPAVIYQNGSASMRYDGQKMRWTVVSSNKADDQNTINGWSLNGNTGTDNTNYVGPADEEVGLYFKAGGKYSGRLDFAHGNTSFGIDALGNSASGGGNNNVAFGQQSLGLMNGNFNTAIGYSAMAEATGGLYNIGIGNQTLNNNQIGLLNLAIGREALGNNTSGNNNIAIGYGALKVNQGGSFNIAIGDNADVVSPNIENAIAIGKNAKVALSNTMVIGGVGDDALRVGVGTQNPLAALHVGSNRNILFPYLHYFVYEWNAFLYESSINREVGIYANKGIVSETFIGAALTVVASDMRIKNIINRTENINDLDLVKKLQITNYRMKDKATWGDKIFKKVIAQEVEKIYPEAVSKQTSVIPDIYAMAEKVDYDENKKELTVSLSIFHDLKIGDKIELVHPEKGKVRATISAVSGNTFTVKDWLYATDKIFVFGREVDDFRVVDYEALSMLGISAIQALAKENEALRLKNDEQKIKNEKMEARLSNIEARLNKLSIEQ